MANLDLSQIRRIHFTGIKGVGMTGLAVIAKEKGFDVTGSDVAERFITDDILEARGIPISVGFTAETIPADIDLLVATGAHGGKTNPQVQAAIARGIPALMHAEALGLFARDKKVIAVAGTHGKSTTSALLAWVLVQAGLDPSYLVGTSTIAGLGIAAHHGTGDYFVIEADEYMTCPVTDPTPRFLHLSPQFTILTNVEHDHPDRYPDLSSVEQAFAALVARTLPEGEIIGCLDNESVAQLIKAAACAVTTYGTGERANYRVSDIEMQETRTSWKITTGERSIPLSIPLAGVHNALNATAVWMVAERLGIPDERIVSAIASFGGLKRRFEVVGETGGVLVLDDYAHHPTEIRATLSAAKGRFPDRRRIVVFQAHTFSRTAALFDDFCTAFTEADVLLLLPIFGSARETAPSNMSTEKLLEGIRRAHPNVVFLENQATVLDWLASHTLPGDLVLTMGAGDVYKIGERFVTRDLPA